MKWNEMKWNEMKLTEMKWNEMKWNEMYLVLLLCSFILANKSRKTCSRCSQVKSEISIFPSIPVHVSASLRSLNTLFVLVSHCLKVRTFGYMPLPLWAAAMRCWYASWASLRYCDLNMKKITWIGLITHSSN